MALAICGALLVFGSGFIDRWSDGEGNRKQSKNCSEKSNAYLLLFFVVVITQKPRLTHCVAYADGSLRPTGT